MGGEATEGDLHGEWIRSSDILALCTASAASTFSSDADATTADDATDATTAAGATVADATTSSDADATDADDDTDAASNADLHNECDAMIEPESPVLACVGTVIISSSVESLVLLRRCRRCRLCLS